jgi:hypothetical protein
VGSWRDKKFSSKKIGMVICSVCDGYARIGYPDNVKVSQYSGGYGFIMKEGKLWGRRTTQFEKPFQPGSSVMEE